MGDEFRKDVFILCISLCILADKYQLSKLVDHVTPTTINSCKNHDRRLSCGSVTRIIENARQSSMLRNRASYHLCNDILGEEDEEESASSEIGAALGSNIDLETKITQYVRKGSKIKLLDMNIMPKCAFYIYVAAANCLCKADVCRRSTRRTCHDKGYLG
ncbi:hypothetical protein BJ878DRAFT_527241 [Calycina marina]|uniref:Uncharacterized protein n=1 Tax=Calycina marina TaxID=1763456 RepID=A0A9P7YUZ0_9HELO|nr:hypothetical protein BJ878DRAFT_527241 [Calycina marina]